MSKLIPILILFICTSVFGQDLSIKKGYLVTNEGDTTQVMLQHNDLKNFNYCHVKNGSEIIKYEPNELKGYYFVNGEHYVSKKIKINTDTYKELFLEYIVEGTKSIYLSREKGYKRKTTE